MKPTAKPSKASTARKAAPPASKLPALLLPALDALISRFGASGASGALESTAGVVTSAPSMAFALYTILLFARRVADTWASGEGERLWRDLRAAAEPPAGHKAVIFWAKAGDLGTPKENPVTPQIYPWERIGLCSSVDLADTSKASTLDLLTAAIGSFEGDPVESLIRGLANDLNLLGCALDSEAVRPTAEAVQNAVYSAAARASVAAELHKRTVRA